jgi:hypothetical protein
MNWLPPSSRRRLPSRSSNTRIVQIVVRVAWGDSGAYSQTSAGVPGLSVTDRPYSPTSPSALGTSHCTQHGTASSRALVRLTWMAAISPGRKALPTPNCRSWTTTFASWSAWAYAGGARQPTATSDTAIRARLIMAKL